MNITGGPGLTLIEVDQATKIIFEQAGEDANIIFGAVIDPDMGDDMMVTVIATGFNQKYRNELVNESTSTENNNLVSEKTFINLNKRTFLFTKRMMIYIQKMIL